MGAVRLDGVVDVCVVRRKSGVVFHGDFHGVAKPAGDFVDAGAGLGMKGGEGVAHVVRTEPGGAAAIGKGTESAVGVKSDVFAFDHVMAFPGGDDEGLGAVDGAQVAAGHGVEGDDAGAVGFGLKGGGALDGDGAGGTVGGEGEPIGASFDDFVAAEAAVEAKNAKKAQVVVGGVGDHVVANFPGDEAVGAGGVGIAEFGVVAGVGGEVAAGDAPGEEGGEVAPVNEGGGGAEIGGVVEGVDVVGGDGAGRDVASGAEEFCEDVSVEFGGERGAVPAGALAILEEGGVQDRDGRSYVDGAAGGEEVAVGLEGSREVAGAQGDGFGPVAVAHGGLVVVPTTLCVEASG